MQRTLLAAAVYNIVWGGFAILFPHALFDWLGIARCNYPQFWQCIGMIVGVYGVGYAIAASDPARHWPIILVGFLGKVFGPLGMAHSLWTEALPWSFAVNCLTNDLIWWVPFALILRYAWITFLTEGDYGPLPGTKTLLAETFTRSGTNLADLSERLPILLIFLRHAGCTFCREALSDVAARRSEIEAKGVRVVLVHMSPPEAFARFSAEYGLADLPDVSDPERRLYRGLGLRRGTLAQLLGWDVWLRGARAFFSGHRVGPMEGDGTQMPGVFLVHRGQVMHSFIHKKASDRPDYVALCEMPKGSTGAGAASAVA